LRTKVQRQAKACSLERWLSCLPYRLPPSWPLKNNSTASGGKNISEKQAALFGFKLTPLPE
jgi:hypothetical protein